jgi:hypothetical protein
MMVMNSALIRPIELIAGYLTLTGICWVVKLRSLGDKRELSRLTQSQRRTRLSWYFKKYLPFSAKPLLMFNEKDPGDCK